MSRRRRNRWRVELTSAQLASLAAGLVEGHGEYLAEGFALCGSSGMWRRADGSLTIRFVYRRRYGTGHGHTIVHTFRTRR